MGECGAVHWADVSMNLSVAVLFMSIAAVLIARAYFNRK